MRVKFSIIYGVGVLKIEGDLNQSVSARLKKILSDHLKESENLVVELSGLTSIDASGLACLIFGLRRATDRKGDLRLAKVDVKIMMVFQITKAYRIFSFYDDVQSAVNSFSEQPELQATKTTL